MDSHWAWRTMYICCAVFSFIHGGAVCKKKGDRVEVRVTLSWAEENEKWMERVVPIIIPLQILSRFREVFLEKCHYLASVNENLKIRFNQAKIVCF